MIIVGFFFIPLSFEAFVTTQVEFSIIVFSLDAILINLLISTSKLANKKIWMIVIISIFFSIIVLKLLAPFGIPEFIRVIPGKDFVFIWICYAAIVLVFGIIALYIFTKSYLPRCINSILETNYKDEDLMFINKISRYKRVGYYILKLKMDGIIDFCVVCENKDVEKTMYIKFSDRYSKEEIDYYCKANPEVKSIVEQIIAHNNLNDGSLLEVKSVVLANDIKVGINVANCKIYVDSYLKYKLGTLPIVAITFFLIYGMAFSKLFMGSYFGKPTTFLEFTMIFSIFLTIMIVPMVNNFCEKQIKNYWLDKINAKYNNDCPPGKFEQILTLERVATEFEKELVLNKFLTEDSKYFAESNIPFVFSSLLFGTIASAELAAIGTISGSGCSGCSGCGGGCGGCGGCGD